MNQKRAYYIFRVVYPDEVTLSLTRKNKLAVICIQAFLFGIVHLNPIKCIYTFVFGIVLGIVYQKTQNLLFPICMHIGFNIRYPVLYLLFIAGYRLN